jgi:hypothetical protein
MQQPPRRTVLLVGRHRPHEIGLLLVSAIVGTAILVGPSNPDIVRVFPGWEALVWAWIVAASSVVGLAGCLWRGRASTGLMLEGAGMLISAAAVAWYVAAVLIGAGQVRSAGQAALTAGVWGAMNVWRTVQINFDLRALR